MEMMVNSCVTKTDWQGTRVNREKPVSWLVKTVTMQTEACHKRERNSVMRLTGCQKTEEIVVLFINERIFGRAKKCHYSKQ